MGGKKPAQPVIANKDNTKELAAKRRIGPVPTFIEPLLTNDPASHSPVGQHTQIESAPSSSQRTGDYAIDKVVCQLASFP
jgi:hypothetical protein